VTQGSFTNWRIWLWSYAPILLWIGVIFFLSSPNGSASNTSLIVGPLLQYFFPDMSEASREVVHMYVRKTAHFTEYGLLALLMVRAVVKTTPRPAWLRWLLPVVVVALVASLDEYNQSFEPSRTSSIYDVMLDIAGGATGVAFCYAVSKRWSARSA
jgi:VanZ family protein